MVEKSSKLASKV